VSEGGSVIGEINTLKQRLKNTYRSLRSKLLQNLRAGDFYDVDDLLSEVDRLEDFFDLIFYSIVTPSQGARSRSGLETVISHLRNVGDRLKRLREHITSRAWDLAISELDSIYADIQTGLRIIMSVFAGWKTTLLRVAFPEQTRYIAVEELPPISPLAQQIYSVLLEEGEMRLSELRSRFPNVSRDELERVIEELQAHDLVEVRLRRGEVWIRGVPR